MKEYSITSVTHMLGIVGMCLLGVACICFLGKASLNLVTTCGVIGSFLCLTEIKWLFGISKIKDASVYKRTQLFSVTYVWIFVTCLMGMAYCSWWPTIPIHYNVVRWLSILFVICLSWGGGTLLIKASHEDDPMEDPVFFQIGIMLAAFLFFVGGVYWLLTADPSQLVIPAEWSVSSFAELSAR